MNKRALATIVAMFAVLVGGIAVATPAEAATTPGCVTKYEWKYKIKKGMTRAQVYRAVGTNGRIDWSSESEDSDGTRRRYIDYKQCYRNGKPARYGTIWVSYNNYKYDYDYNVIFTAFRSDTKGTWYAPY
jgi:hypothetical protein